MTSDWQEGMAKAVAALKQSELDKAMNECAQMAPLVRRHMLKKGDVLLLNTKFRELDKNGDRKIQWHEFEQGRSALPTSIQVSVEGVQSESSKTLHHADCQCRAATSFLAQRRRARSRRRRRGAAANPPDATHLAWHLSRKA